MYGADTTLLRPRRTMPPMGQPQRQPAGESDGMDQQAMPQQRGNPQTFAQMRAAGMARPAAPAPVPQATRDAVAANVANPSAYGAPQAMDTFSRLNAALSEQFGLQRRQLDQQAARRGMYDSSVAVGQLGDLATQQARAQSELVQQIAERAALQQQQDRASAIQQSLALAGMDQSAGQFDQQQALARVLGLGGLDLQGRQLQQQADQFGANQTLTREQMALQNAQFGQQQQLTRDQMLQQLALFFGLPGGDIGPAGGAGGVSDAAPSGYGLESPTISWADVAPYLTGVMV